MMVEQQKIFMGHINPNFLELYIGDREFDIKNKSNHELKKQAQQTVKVPRLKGCPLPKRGDTIVIDRSQDNVTRYSFQNGAEFAFNRNDGSLNYSYLNNQGEKVQGSFSEQELIQLRKLDAAHSKIRGDYIDFNMRTEEDVVFRGSMKERLHNCGKLAAAGMVTTPILSAIAQKSSGDLKETIDTVGALALGAAVVGVVQGTRLCLEKKYGLISKFRVAMHNRKKDREKQKQIQKQALRKVGASR